MIQQYFSLFFLLFGGTLFAQTLSGVVTDEFQYTVEEATILNTKTTHFTYTDGQGNFFLDDVSVGDTLLIEHLSYQTKYIRVKDLNTPLNIVLSNSSINLNEIVISPSIDPLHLIADIDLRTNPVNSSQDLLRKVPGLFIGQHAGGGKAEQLFLRGFDIDHGTDINVTVDGLPVNMVSHAHGQGYADLHFIIPETIQKIDFGKGPYYENKGNFNTAGYANFVTKRKLQSSSVKLEAGQFDSFRLLGMFNLLDNDTHNAYLATEFLSSDGPFDSPQNFNRTNIVGKYSGVVSKSEKVGITASYFDSKWDASGQIPQRAVDSGAISRFGAIDDTEGGTTSRTNLLINYDKIIDEQSSLKSFVFWSQYDFELFSNFTFFLENPILGDQIRQRENRNIYGLISEYKKSFASDIFRGTWHAGISLRNDKSDDNELSRTANRSETIEQLQLGDIDETNVAAYLGTSIDISGWTLKPSVRVDYFDFQYNDALLSNFQTQTETEFIVNPNLNILYTHSHQLQLYLKLGKGFHSNDTRVVIAEEGREILPAAYGMDAGFIWKPSPKVILNATYWYLFLEQEFVYVGDAGIVEPSGRTRRQGVDLSYRYQPFPWLYWNVDATYSYARSVEESDGQDFIPLAPNFTLVSGISVSDLSGFYGGINFRYLADRPANEDNSIIAEGYAITDLNLGYKRKNISLGIQIQNLFNVEWNETQFATESRLFDEPNPIEEIHFTPGSPFFLKTVLEYSF